MPRFPIAVPLGGLSETFAFDEQPPRTSRDAKNDRGRDPRTGRYRGASRAGLRKFTTSPIASAPVRRIEQVVYDVPSHQFTSAGANSTIAWSDANPTKTDTKGIDTDPQSNIYALDGVSGLVKENSSGVQLWKTSIPTQDKSHECQAIRVDRSTGFVYVGVSAGGDSTKGQLFCYRQKEANQTALVWTVDIGGYVSQLRIYNTQLYCLLNFPDRNRTYVRVYDGITSGAPTQTKEWEVMSGGNDFDISPVDGSVFEASGADARRGNDPRSPGSSQISSDWEWTKLPNFKDRVWSWFDASDRDSLALSPASPDAGDDGAEVVVWFDKSGKSRNWYANRAISSFPAVPSTESGPLYKPVGLGGRPSVSFSGETYNGSGAGNTAGRSMVGQPASSTDRAYRNEQLSPVPTYKGAQFVLFLVVKAGVDETMRGLLSLPSPGSNTASKLLTINRRDDNDVPGTVPMPGSVSWRDPNGHASDSGTSTPPAGGPSGSPSCAPGMLPASGVAVITIICDGGVHDGNSQNGLVGQSSRSVLRINGHPVDRWQSESFSTSEAITLGLAYLGSSGHSRFAGLVCEMRVLSDWYDQSGVQQRLVTCPGYPDSLWSPNGDTEVERIEGELAHKWGFAHELETGQAAWMTMSQPSNTETLTVGPITYRFVTALAQSNDVLIGSSVFVTAGNLYKAIGRIGNPGVDYDQRTERNSQFLAMAATQIGSTNTCRIPIRSISPYSTQLALAASSGGNITWDATTTRLTINGSGTSSGWYPHPFTLKKTTNSRGGPPGEATNTQGQISAAYLLQSPYPALSKWSANTGKPVWVATSGYNVTALPANGNTSVTTAGSGIGGVGLAVRIGSTGQVFSVGNQQPVVSGREAVLADAVDIRKLGDTGSAFSIAGSGDPWTEVVLALGSNWDSSIIRCDIDKFDNFYVPVNSSSASLLNASLLAYRSASDASGGGVEFLRYSGLPLHQDCYAVTVDPNIPEYPVGDLVRHAEFVYLGSKDDPSDTANLSIFKIRIISSTLLPGEGRVRKIIAICGGKVARIDGGGAPVVLAGGVDANAPYVDTAAVFGKIFITDGSNLYVYDPKTDTLSLYQPTSAGQFLPRCKLLTGWNGRLVGAESADNGNNWFMSKSGDPFDCDINTFILSSPTEQQAVLGADSRAGFNPDKITALIALRDDLMILGCDHAIFRFTGDPMAGGTFHPVSQVIGMVGGRCFAQDPYGVLYFMATRGGIYRMLPDANTIQPLSLEKIPERLDAIDFTVNRVELAWSPDEDGLRVMVVPLGSGGFHVEHFFWERRTDSWHSDEYGNTTTTNMQPTCVFSADGDAPDDRVLLFGGEDGIVRQVDTAAVDDDGFPIDSSMLLGPFLPDNEGEEYMYTDFEIVLDKRQRGARWCIHATDLSQDPGDEIASGELAPGRNKILARARGAAVWIRIGSAALDGGWAIESIACRAEPMGITRAVR